MLPTVLSVVVLQHVTSTSSNVRTSASAPAFAVTMRENASMEVMSSIAVSNIIS